MIHLLDSLLIMQFSILNKTYPSTLASNSNFVNYWSILKDFEYQLQSFEHIATIAFRLFSNVPSESDAERGFSELKWRFPDRRNRVTHNTMLHQLHVTYFHNSKVKNKKKDKKTSIWKVTPKINKKI